MKRNGTQEAERDDSRQQFEDDPDSNSDSEDRIKLVPPDVWF